MGRPESTFWKTLKKNMNNWQADRIETSTAKGFPDVIFNIHPLRSAGLTGKGIVWGVIELKALESLPVRSRTTVKLPHYTTEQKYYLKKYRGFLLVKVIRPKCFFLLDWAAAQLMAVESGKATDGLTVEETKEKAYRFYDKRLDYDDLLKSLYHYNG